MLEAYDAIVVGAGPAGGQCARQLSHKGHKVLLIDKIKTFDENNFSSGGAPSEIMEEFALPAHLAGSFWDRLRIFSTNEQATWNFPSSFGPILNFDKLRSFLAEDTKKHGGQYQLAHAYISHTKTPAGIEVTIKDLNTHESKSFLTQILVDATGTDRKVLHQKTKESMIATGIEYHIKVPHHVYEEYSKSMNFFLGLKWMPQGYGWVFSMAPSKLKVGVIRYFQNENDVPHDPSYKPYMEQLLNHVVGSHHYEVEDRHGKTISYTLGQKDRRYDGQVLAIGDAVSSINPLGCEGIRHALVSGRLAALEIQKFLNGEVSHFKGYSEAMNQYFGKKWLFSEMMMNHLYKQKNDNTMDRTVKCFGLMNNHEILDVIFNYRFYRTFKSYFWYFASFLKDFLIGAKKKTNGDPS